MSFFIFLLVLAAISRYSFAAADSDSEDGDDTSNTDAAGEDSSDEDGSDVWFQAGIPIGAGIAAVAVIFIIFMLRRKHKI